MKKKTDDTCYICRGIGNVHTYSIPSGRSSNVTIRLCDGCRKRNDKNILDYIIKNAKEK